MPNLQLVLVSSLNSRLFKTIQNIKIDQIRLQSFSIHFFKLNEVITPTLNDIIAILNQYDVLKFLMHDLEKSFQILNEEKINTIERSLTDLEIHWEQLCQEPFLEEEPLISFKKYLKARIYLNEINELSDLIFTFNITVFYANSIAHDAINAVFIYQFKEYFLTDIKRPFLEKIESLISRIENLRNEITTIKAPLFNLFSAEASENILISNLAYKQIRYTLISKFHTALFDTSMIIKNSHGIDLLYYDEPRDLFYITIDCKSTVWKTIIRQAFYFLAINGAIEVKILGVEMTQPTKKSKDSILIDQEIKDLLTTVLPQFIQSLVDENEPEQRNLFQALDQPSNFFKQKKNKANISKSWFEEEKSQFYNFCFADEINDKSNCLLL